MDKVQDLDGALPESDGMPHSREMAGCEGVHSFLTELMDMQCLLLRLFFSCSDIYLELRQTSKCTL